MQVFRDKEAWIEGITNDFLQALAGIPVSRQARLCLAGGKTPEPVYREFSRLMVEGTTGLRSVILVPGDERVSIEGPADLNETMLERAFAPAIATGSASLVSWFGKKPACRSGQADVDRASSMIQTMNASLALMASSGSPVFDLCYLGMGPDGHTAGLFPGMPGLDDPGPCIAGLAPVPPRQRVSLSFSALASTVRTRFILSAPGKEAALERLRNGDPSCPAVRAATTDSIAFILT